MKKPSQVCKGEKFHCGLRMQLGPLPDSPAYQLGQISPRSERGCGRELLAGQQFFDCGELADSTFLCPSCAAKFPE